MTFGFHRFLIIASLLVLISSCGNQTSLSKRQPTPTPNQGGSNVTSPYLASGAPTPAINHTSMPAQNFGGAPIYLAIGGFSSCQSSSKFPSMPTPHGMNLFEQFNPFFERQKVQFAESNAEFVLVCFNTNNEIGTYIESSAMDQIKNGSRLDIYRRVEQIAMSKNAPVVIIGHSYGGAYAMEAALSINPQVSIRHLFTLDAISPLGCPPSVLGELINSRLDFLLGKGGQADSAGLGCQQAPVEFSVNHQRAIRARVGWWHNYHQSDLLSVLKSSAISQACNQPVKHGALLSFLNGHVAMGKYAKVWLDMSVINAQDPKSLSCLPKDL